MSIFAPKMANDYFEFRQFLVRQSRCAMKVGTDGTLLGAWAEMADSDRGDSPCRILDIGTGTGLMALMMAQRFPEAQVTAIDIDSEAVAQAADNVRQSPFAARINVLQADVCLFDDPEGFDLIVCNPPFFADALVCPDEQRATARHTISLSYSQLIDAVWRLLKPSGTFSVVVPTDCLSRLESAARLKGFFLSRRCSVKTTPKKSPKRQLIEYRKISVSEFVISEDVLETSPGVRSPWYHQLTKDFYLH